MDARHMYEAWLAHMELEENEKAELKALTEDEIIENFGRELEFGTGGLRGVLGLGNNRMNVYTIRKATQGLANHLNESNEPKSVAIAFDSRINSDLFAKEAACVLAANEIQVWIYPRLEPTPALSWAVRERCCGAGICITASHNPAKYNGYKVYGSDGCQITLEAAEQVTKHMACIDIIHGIQRMEFSQGMEAGLIRYMPEETIEAYLSSVENLQILKNEKSFLPLKVVYTPLNGAGLECVEKILKAIHISDVVVVPEQREPDGRFSTCPYPNPEIREAMQKGLELCEQEAPDLLLATDPDCDRCGIAVPTETGYSLMTGNEVGILLLDYICKARIQTGVMPPAPIAITTIVSSQMATPVAKKYGVDLRRTLTGFKFIGEQIGLLEKAGEEERFIFGFEESYGYLSGTHVRDKDAVNAAMLICEMARYYKAQGKSLMDAMEDLYKEHGIYQTALYTAAYEGLEGMEKMAAVMKALRENPPKHMAEWEILACIDYLNTSLTGLPSSDVLEFHLAGESMLIVRPSGTEPKIKAYLSTKGNVSLVADQKMQALLKAVSDFFTFI